MDLKKLLRQGQCYMEDGNEVGMNIEIIDTATQDVSDHQESSIPKKKPREIIFTPVLPRIQKVTVNPVNISEIELCTEHPDLFLLEDEKLVKPGDKFNTHEDFVQYVNENAKRWFFYYKCYDSKKNEMFTYTCVYLKGKEKYVKKGLRKRNNNLKTDCPCKIKLKQLPNEKELTAVYVCNHHDHILSEDEFYKLQHGRRLPPFIKEEIMDLTYLKIDVTKIKRYVEAETGFDMSRTYFFTIARNMKTKNVKRHITEDRLTELLAKINEANNRPEFMEVELQPKKKNRKRIKPIEEKPVEEVETVQPEPSTNYISPEMEVEESVRNLQESIKCNEQNNKWINDQCVPVLPINGSLITNKKGMVTLNINNDGKVFATKNENTCYMMEYVNGEGDGNVNVQEESGENDIDNGFDSYIAYETIVTDDDNIEVNESDMISESQDDDNLEMNSINNVIENNASQNEEYTQCVDETLHNNSEMSVVEHYDSDVENDTVQESECHNISESSVGCDVGVQTSNDKPGHSYVPVFDVYMKNGNVTGFIVKDDVVKDRIEKAVQTDDLDDSNTESEEECEEDNNPIPEGVSKSNKGKYTKHEYIHKYNIDQYMVQPYFPKYLDTLAMKTDKDIMDMLTNVYKEKAMFKMTTTQNGREGNTTIWYIKEAPRLKPMFSEIDAWKDQKEANLNDVIRLKEKVKCLKKINLDLVARNKHLVKLVATQQLTKKT